MKLRSIVCAVLLGLFLASCNPEKFHQTEGNVADVETRVTANRNHFINQGKKPTVAIKEGFYVDTTPIDLSKSPPWLGNSMVLRGEQLPFSFYSRAVAQGAGQTVLTTFQSDLDPAVQLSLNYTGTVRGALDALASKTGYLYTVRGNRIHWEAFVTKTFDVGFMPGSSDYMVGKAAGSSDSGGGSSSSGGAGGSTKDYVSSDPSNSEFSSLSATKLSIWKDLENTLSKMVSDKGKVVVSEASTTVTVTDRPYYVDMVSKYIDNLNQSLSKQVLVKVQILEVLLQDDYTYGINWNNIIHAFKNTNFRINANYGTPISITAFGGTSGTTNIPVFGFEQASGGGIPAYQALVNALSQQGKTSVVSEPRVLCLNNQVSAIRIVGEENYIASIQNTSQSTGTAIGTTTSQITPGKVTTGLTLYILPKILNDHVFLQVNADISTNLGVTPLSVGEGAGKTTIGLPKVSMKHFNQRSMIKSGDTLILSGFKQISNQANEMEFLRSRSLGGQGSKQNKTETIILITPIILNGSA